MSHDDWIRYFRHRERVLSQEYHQENAARSIQAWFRGQRLRIRLEVLDDLAVRLFVPGDADDPIEVSGVDEDFTGTVAQPIDVDLEISFAYAGGEFYPDDLGAFSPHEGDFSQDEGDFSDMEEWTPPSITDPEDYDEDDSDFSDV